MDLQSFGSVLLLIFGFGFVIFFHELGHFLAAKWADVRVEQFAVGFGQAIFSWRKGMGFTLGSSGKKLAQLQEDVKAGQSNVDLSKIGETEYRLNWIPLGGYVKMLGQDDLNPNAIANDPRAYNRKSVGKRMVIISAGVIMNIILAAIGFMVLFLVGFGAPSTVIGSVATGSPAATAKTVDGKLAPVRPGDRYLTINGAVQHDYTKIALNTALLKEGEPAHVTVKRRDGRVEELRITPRAPAGSSGGFMQTGILPAYELRGMSRLPKKPSAEAAPYMLDNEVLLVKPGEWISHINGVRVAADEKEAADVSKYWILTTAIQDSGGKPVSLTVEAKDGPQQRQVQPRFTGTFDDALIAFAGMLPRTEIAGVVSENSPVFKKILPGDIVTMISAAGDPIFNPTGKQLREALNDAGDKGQKITLRVLRDGKEVDVGPVSTVSLEGGQKGLGIGLGTDDLHAVVAGSVNDSPAAKAGIPTGATIQTVADKPVTNWFEVRDAMVEVNPDEPFKVTAALVSGESRDFELTLTADEIETLRGYQLAHGMSLHEAIETRQTSSPLTAASWGISETRDFILQFYVTLQRMVQGTVHVKNMMGPVGIIDAGTKFADRGMDWLLWFLCMISANLAVVNFLPIPIVDGGHFLFLIIEKIKGRPLGERAQSIAQGVGLVLLLSVFLLVTYQDIMRLFFRL